ncbi:MAG: CotH kinase family protein [Limisphaerales bacterium]
MKRFEFGRWSAGLVVVMCIATAVAVRAAEAPKKLGRKATEAEQLFAGEAVLKIQIEIAPEDIKKLEKYSFQFGQAQQDNREQVKAVVREGGKTYKDVALQLKGAAGSFRSIHDNPAVTLNFDKFVDGQTFHGLDKLSLNNSVQDQTLVSEQFSREMFLKAGVPVPRATHATVELNGRDLGLYVLVQGWNKRFLKQHFEKTSGNLYDGGFLKDIDQKLDTNSGDSPDDQSDRIELLAAAREKDLGKRRERLEKVLDVDRFLSFVAMDVMLWNWDGYAQNKNNYRLFSDTATGKMVFMPHGLDQMFWKPDGPILPSLEGFVAKAVLQIPELREKYFVRMKELRTTVFNPQEMTNRVYQIAAKVRPILKEKDASLAEQQEGAVATFVGAVVRRARSIDEQLATPIVPIEFDASGKATLTSWEAATIFGKPDMKKEGETLQARATKGSSIGAWRTKVWLEPGDYRVEAKIKTSGIKPDLGDTRAGAGLRVGKDRMEKTISGDTDWTALTQRFSVSDPLAQMQFQCEFRGIAGEAEFQSIQLTKVAAKKEAE